MCIALVTGDLDLHWRRERRSSLAMNRLRAANLRDLRQAQISPTQKYVVTTTNRLTSEHILGQLLYRSVAIFVDAMLD